MDDRSFPHPTPEALTAFSQGALDDRTTATLEEHVAGCDACREALAALPEPPLVARVRAAATFPGSGVGRWRLHAGHEVLEEIGRGGMGVVYKARQVGLGRLVALKYVRAGGDTRPETLARFRREAETVARLDHPNIVQIYEVGEQDGQPYLALEYVPGGNLAQKLAGTPLPPAAAARLVETLARAVAHAHRQGIVHRDLKPANVLLASGGREPPVPAATAGSRPPLADLTPKIGDFGLAKLVDRETVQTRSGAIVGTPAYMAPEQAGGLARHVGPQRTCTPWAPSSTSA